MKVREGGRVVDAHLLVATGVNADGHREILGLDICSAESEAGWLTLFRGLNARGLTGVKHVTSDAHSGLVAAVAATLKALLAKVSHPLRGQPDGDHPQGQPGLGQGDAALDL